MLALAVGCGGPEPVAEPAGKPVEEEPILEDPPRAPPLGNPRPKLTPGQVVDEAALREGD
jgi:hypothetical protein